MDLAMTLLFQYKAPAIELQAHFDPLGLSYINDVSCMRSFKTYVWSPCNSVWENSRLYTKSGVFRGSSKMHISRACLFQASRGATSCYLLHLCQCFFFFLMNFCFIFFTELSQIPNN